MLITSRPYAGAADFHKVRAFMLDPAALAGAHGYMHIGDVGHRLSNGLHKYNLGEVMRLWEDTAGRLLGWALVYPDYNGFDVLAHSAHRGGALEAEMLDWAGRSTFAWLRKLGRGGGVNTDVFDGDGVRAEMLAQRGYVAARTQSAYVYTARALGTPIPDIDLPDGFSVRSATAGEVAALAEVHNGSFDSSWTPESYGRVMQSPAYDAARELVVVAPDGRFAAFCVYWPDPVRKTGLFEPVGTHRDFRRRGFAGQVMYEGMRRMRAQGIETAMVCYNPGNPPSQKLYTSLGFAPVDKIYAYEKHTESGTP
ncbi:MAG: GNAT family N-acetyltransferase [Anaerolineae bacterium]|nr:GNAT family N-acetyltransferase [Anaerolineae bacterium]